MMHKPIQFASLSLSFPHKTCFHDFSGQIHDGDRIAIIGRNGSGKSTLLKLFAGLNAPTEGEIYLPKELNIGYVPQVIEQFDCLSGGQRFNKLLTQALSAEPQILMLDEPSNHLDRANRRSLIRMLSAFAGTLVIVTHDLELLRATINTIWHIDDHGNVRIFSGCYEDYLHELNLQRRVIEHELMELKQQQKQLHQHLMKEQERASNSHIRGEKSKHQKKWPAIISGTKARKAQETSGRKKNALNQQKDALNARLSSVHLSEIIRPKFVLNGINSKQTLVTVDEGSVGYDANRPLLHNLRFTLKAQERIAILGDNGSGKSTLIKAIIGTQSLIITGKWSAPNRQEIGYLDQHYTTLSAKKTVLETISCLLPTQSYTEIRRFLNDFLFRKNEEVDALVTTLSGGEKARLSLAQIAARPPKLLILDEITNNLDRETRAHVIQVLKEYPGAMMVISHDLDFLNALTMTTTYQIKDGLLT